MGLTVLRNVLWCADVMTWIGWAVYGAPKSVLINKTDKAQALKGLQGGVLDTSAIGCDNFGGLTEQECSVSHCVRGPFKYGWIFAYQIRMLCVVDRYDELSIPNQDSGLDLYHGVGFLRPSQDNF